jgi:dynein heavy chain
MLNLFSFFQQNSNEFHFSVAKQTDELKEKLKVEEIEVTKKNQEADRLIKVVETETKKVTEQRESAAIEEKEVAEKKERVAERQAESDRDLQKALPALKAAEEALNTLNRNNLTELKSFATPPAAILKVTASLQILLSPPSKDIFCLFESVKIIFIRSCST